MLFKAHLFHILGYMEDTGYTGLMRISEEVAVELGEEQVDLDLSDSANVETLLIFQFPLL